MNETSIVFSFADDLWIVPREGGAARRLTSAPGFETAPHISPDGKWVAFTGNYDGNEDVYVVPADGGIPRRLTAHPSPDVVTGWTPDGKSVVFLSFQLRNTDSARLFTAPATGGFPTPLPFPSCGSMASMSPDGKRLAYVPNLKWENAWKRYRGGQGYRIWLGDLSDSKVKEIPRSNFSEDSNPIWVGSKVYFLSDRKGPVGLYCYDTVTGATTEEVAGTGFDIKNATAGPGGIVYEKLGGIYLYDTVEKTSKKVPITVNGDFLESRTGFRNIAENLESFSLSPSGNRAVVSARGYIATIPAKKGDARILDEAPGLHRRDPAWSPDGKTVAYITDRDLGRQQMALYDVQTRKERVFELGEAPNFYYRPNWSPDGTKIAYTDYRSIIWIMDVATGKNTKVDGPIFGDPTHTALPEWSPDSKWITYSRDLSNHFNAIFLYDVVNGKSTQITDGLASADSPVFDKSGKYLYFYATTNIGPRVSWLDLSNFQIPNLTQNIYAVVLKNEYGNPLQPESDEEAIKAEPAKADAAPASPPKEPAKETPKPAASSVELAGIEQRIIALPIPARGYTNLFAGPDGSVLALSAAINPTPNRGGGPGTLWKFSFDSRNTTPFAQNVFSVAPNISGSKLLVSHGDSFEIVSTAGPAAAPGGEIDLSNIQAKVNPREEWKHMLHEIWENERNCFYASNTHGIDTREIERKYAPFFETVQSRRDLNYLFEDMLGEICIGHMFPDGGQMTNAKYISGGLLGADYTFSNGKYRLAKVYTGENWNPNLYAPLAQPGVLAKEGEYIHSIDGDELKQATDIYALLEGKAGKQVKVKLGSKADGSDAREVTVVPIANEFQLRFRAWSEDNRKYVEKMTQGRGGYVHIPDTANGGWTEFQRYYYAQLGKDGMVIDERFNHGGLINDYMIHEMEKKLDAAFAPRYMQPWPTPGAAIFGPKVMLANEMSGSGGDMFPWLFKKHKIGKLIGKRTWGGLVAAASFGLVDGGQINAPDYAFFNVETGTWDVENWGVSPDIEVELDPYLWRQGKDAQLDRAIAELNKSLKDYKAPVLKRPAFPDKTKLGVRY